MVKVYKKLGFEVDTVKTIYSSIKYIYLNRFMLDGAEVSTGLKTFLKADIEKLSRYKGIQNKCLSIMQTLKGSVKNGWCPIHAYYFGIHEVLDTL